MRIPSALVPFARRMRDAGFFYYRKVGIYSRDITENNLPITMTDVQVHQAIDEDFDELTSADRARFREEWRKRLEAGNICLVAKMSGSLAGYLWIMHGPAPIREVNSHFDVSKLPDAAYVHNVYVLPEYREIGVYAALLAEASRRSRGSGIKTLYTAVAKDNIASERARRSAGFDTEVTRIRFLKILGMESRKVKVLAGGGSVANAVS